VKVCPFTVTLLSLTFDIPPPSRVAAAIHIELISEVVSAQFLVNEGHSPEQTQMPALSEHVEARTALLAQPRKVTIAMRLSFMLRSSRYWHNQSYVFDVLVMVHTRSDE